MRETDKTELQIEIRKRASDRLFPILDRYALDYSDLDAILKWKPVVLIIGNYSSGKSTLVNELLDLDIQRTGQAPTDDSFTIITASNKGEDAADIQGATLINNENLPFTSFKAYGDRLASHLLMKKLNSALLENLTIIDSPGMLDSVTEKGRGYDFPKVIGDFAKLADLVVLMFDPHKAGTIKETYTTIRNTLFQAAGEDRVVFVMSRIDECDNLHDLLRSYGTLCWNLSQMTGRKDIPRIYLTYSPIVGRKNPEVEQWIDDRNQMKQKILEAPKMKISNILHHIDRKSNELKMVIEAMIAFREGGFRLGIRTLKEALMLSVLMSVALFFSGLIPAEPYLSGILGTAASVLLMSTWLFKWRLPRYIKRCRANVNQLVTLDTAYKEHTWERVRKNVQALLAKPGFEELRFPHFKNLEKINAFIKRDLQRYYTLK